MTARGLGALCTATVMLSACGGGSGKSATSVSTPAGHTQTATPSSGTVTSADGRFTTVTPVGFTDATALARGGPIQYLVLGPRSGGFTTNINVIREPSGGVTDIDAIAHAELSGIKRLQPQARRFSSLEPVTVGGAPARVLDYLNRPSGRLLHQRQVFVEHGGWIYTVTYSALPTTYAASVDALEEVISSWRWT